MRKLFEPFHFAKLAVACMLALSAAILTLAPTPPVQAAVTNYSTSAQVVFFPFQFSGAYSATAAGAVKFNMPMACDLVGVGASARAISGTTNTIDVKLGGVSVLSAPITIAAAGTYTEGTITTTAITDEGAITIDINIVATSLTDVTVLLTCVRK